MSLLLIESFDHIQTVTDLFAGVLSSLSATADSGIAISRTTQFNGQSIALTTSSPTGLASSAYTTIYIATTSTTMVIGAAIQLTASPNSGYDIGLTNGSLAQVFCRFILNRLLIYRGDPVLGGYVLLGSAATSLLSSGWAYVEVKATIATGTAGAMSVYANGRLIITLPFTNTSNDGTTTVAGGLLGAYDGSGTGFTGYFDDVYLLDTNSVAPINDVLGPVRVILRLPSANAAVNFIPNQNQNWQQISETKMDGDSSYNSSTTIAASDLFQGFSLPVTTTQVFAVQNKIAVRKDDAGQRAVGTLLSSSTAIVTGATNQISPNYQYFSDLYRNDPNTGVPWTIAGVNALLFGYTIVS